MTAYTVFLEICFLFFFGSILGWVLEVFFRRFFSAKKWINPGFLTGPCLPIYGLGVAFLYALCFIPINTGMVWLDDILLILIMGVVMTLIEYIGGLVFIKGMHIKLWDYSKQPGNIQGIICPLFSLIWTAVGALYFFFMHPFMTSIVGWFEANIAFAFVVGVCFGVFIIDLAHSLDLSVRIRKFAKTNKTVIAFEKLKLSIKEDLEEKKKKANFVFPFRSKEGLENHMKVYLEKLSQKIASIKGKGDKEETEDEK